MASLCNLTQKTLLYQEVYQGTGGLHQTFRNPKTHKSAKVALQSSHSTGFDGLEEIDWLHRQANKPCSDSETVESGIEWQYHCLLKQNQSGAVRSFNEHCCMAA